MSTVLLTLSDSDPNNPPTVTEPLGLAQAVAFALSSNFEVKTAKAKAEGTHWDYLGSIGAFFPSISYERQQGEAKTSPAAYHSSDSGSAPENAIVGEAHYGTSSRTIIVKQPVADLSLITEILARSQTDDASRADAVASREKVALDTITSYFRLIHSRLGIGFASDYKAHLDRLAQRMKDRVAGGGASGVELDRINGRSVSAKSAMIEAGAEYQAALVEFRRLTNVTPIKLRLPASLLPEIPDNVADVLARARQNNPDYQAALLRSDAADAAAAKPFANLLPKFSVQYTDSRTYNAGDIAAENPTNVTPSLVYPYANDVRVMGVLDWTLNGLVDPAQGMANAAYARQASFQASDTRQRLEESVRVGFDALNAASHRIDAVKKAVASNTRVAAAFEEQYVNGSRQLLDLLDAYERLYQSQVELGNLLVSEATAGFLVRRQMGELVDAIIKRDKD